MALDKNRLGDAIKTKVDAQLATLSQSSDPADAAAYRTALYRGIAEAIIDEIKANAEIGSLTCNQTPNDGAAHIHNVSTVSGQKVIT